MQDSTVPLISMEYAFTGGAAQDPAQRPGVAHMVSGLLKEGSGKFDFKTFHQRLDRHAIELRFHVTHDHFRGALRTINDSAEEAFELLRIALTSPRFEAADVERNRAAVLARLRHDSTDPSSLARRKFLEVAFGDHPYARPVDGYLESVPKIEAEDLKGYVRRVIAKRHVQNRGGRRGRSRGRLQAAR
ncbi:protease [Bradyrhizobium ottawaense]|uniref:Protease n=1 Tax=Bradyrhizobium diazoefficiens TaxID=1355477 RepID=A0A809YCW7_9BRAD|nr:hypothetical protein BJ6T_80300 [Bradyrhizobium japonicum USDA 6]BBO08306.1 protease [Bradyrhizobium ottawaense]BBZ92039.1 protease [Bradyrhizobium diazoefficiens]GEC50494.1 protease [Bradyrhizobium japonicum]BBZ92277.1 protease [Bradyrhizobium diazoefficiens]